MEQTEKRYRSNRDDLLRTIIGLDSGLISLDQANGDGVVGMDRVSAIGARFIVVHHLIVAEQEEEEAGRSRGCSTGGTICSEEAERFGCAR